jgi:hypothetical protein
LFSKTVLTQPQQLDRKEKEKPMTRYLKSDKNIFGGGVAAARAIYFAASLILLCVIGQPALAQRGTCPALTFGPAINTPTAVKPVSLAVGDFNRDGKDDLAVTTSQSVLIFLGKGAGQFNAPTTVPRVGSSPGFVTVGDFNKDGRQDLAVMDTDPATNTSTGNISILLGKGDGSFQSSTIAHAGTSADHIAVGDFNADGNPDMVVTFFSLAQVKVYLGNGSGGFPKETTLTTKIGGVAVNGGASVVTGDFNRDGKQDFAVAISNAIQPTKGAIVTFQGDGTGLKFDQKAELPLADPITVTVGDFNQDGKLDIASASFVGAKLFIWRGDGAGNFGSPDIFATLGATSLTPAMVAAADFNLDGKTDLAASTLNGVVEILAEPAAPGTVQLPTFTAGSGVFVGDFNQDGRLDIAAAQGTPNQPASGISVLLNTSRCCF